jgi:chromatin structure-remodeling complex subunit RSC1/2
VTNIKIGDWVHIRNPNDLAKPTVAQIYRTWQDRAGQRWINACWYYRPEQTVHRHEKHFYEHEVVKTGQYRDHQIEDVLDHCFVMFVTRFNKGRPRGFPRGKEIYVCESRYNEEKFTFNKIKTWASCVPDEVRDKDYEMDLYDVPRRMRKIPSPIKHLLREDAKETDELPKPTWGSPNAPPIVGAVHRRPREINVSEASFILFIICFCLLARTLCAYRSAGCHQGFISQCSASITPCLHICIYLRPTLILSTVYASGCAVNRWF